MVIIFCGLAVLLAILVVVWRARVPTRRRYALHMKGDMPTIEGILVARTGREFVLMEAELIEAPDASHPLSNTVRVPRENVFCLQRVSG